MQQDEITMVATAVTEMAAATAEIANNAESTAKNANESVTLGQGVMNRCKSIDSINQLASELNNSTKIIGELENHLKKSQPFFPPSARLQNKLTCLLLTQR